jgi:hypothetical protein
MGAKIMRKRMAVYIALLTGVIVIISSIMVSGQGYRPEVVFRGHDGAAVSVAVADTDYKQAIGLMDRKVLPADQGMLFVFRDDRQRNFWMKDTYIPLDQVYIRSDGTVVDINKNARPLDTVLYWSKPCKYVVEVNGGYCDRHGINIGDKVQIIG